MRYWKRQFKTIPENADKTIPFPSQQDFSINGYVKDGEEKYLPQPQVP